MEHTDSHKNEAVAAEDDETTATGRFDTGECVICLEDPHVEKSSPPCGHVFCFCCLVQWCETKRECPTCKQMFSEFHHGPGWKLVYDAAKDDEKRRQRKIWEFTREIFEILTTPVQLPPPPPVRRAAVRFVTRSSHNGRRRRYVEPSWIDDLLRY